MESRLPLRFVLNFIFTEATGYLRRHQILLKSVMCDCDLACMPEMNLMARYIFMMSSLFSRQAGGDLFGDVVCFLAKLIADPVLT